jgi:hypothetical protein
MTTTARRALLAIALTTALGLSGCGGAATPSASPSAAPPSALPPGSSPAAAAPGEPGGGGSSGNPGTGFGVVPVDPTPVDPAAGQPVLVRPLPGRLNPHPVAPTAIRASVDGRHVLVKLTWYGGVEPCSVLDSVKVERSGDQIALTPFEGASDGSAICIEIAMLKATIVDLGELEPGTYRISSPGSEAPPVEITIA